ncbi:hypothetical protein AC579_1568 [Pseudocercospora musae]|uniref:Uncharacterized protein n=1 Tax=Pseudocercospora musae TaxID=113226 RepID=A0A139I5R1_9PEZI|nr:hypothetical protein AC579_1568 [Pseudocercospora musae]
MGLSATLLGTAFSSEQHWVRTHVLHNHNHLWWLGAGLLPRLTLYYKISGCAAQGNSNYRCTAFDIALERATSTEPSAADGSCLQPPSTTLIKCVLWSGPVNTDNAVNAGQLRNAFQVVIAGSNGYNKLAPPTPSGYNAAVNLGKRAISAPTCSDGTRTAIRQVILSASNGADPLNVTYGAGWCDTEYTRKRPCNFFNAYFGRRVDNGNALGQVCDLYSLPWEGQYATKPQFRFDGPLLNVESSFAFTKTGASAQCTAPAPSSS